MVETREFAYDVDGVTMLGHLAEPDGDAPCPAVLIAHEGAGLTDDQRRRADRLAELGYVAFALDYIGGGRFITEVDEMLGTVRPLLADIDRVRALGRAGLEMLLARPRVDPARVAAIGYCTGGTMALELARSGIDLKAVVAFHPGLEHSRPADAANITGIVLLCRGADAPLVPAEHRRAFEREMAATTVDRRVHLYGNAQHVFTHPRLDPGQSVAPGVAYQEPSARRAWQSMLGLFGETIARPER